MCAPLPGKQQRRVMTIGVASTSAWCLACWLLLATIDCGPNRCTCHLLGRGQPVEGALSSPPTLPRAHLRPCAPRACRLRLQTQTTGLCDHQSSLMRRTDELHGQIDDEHLSLSLLPTGRASWVQKTKSQDTSAATPPGSNLSPPPVTLFKVQFNPPRRKRTEEEPEGLAWRAARECIIGVDSDQYRRRVPPSSLCSSIKEYKNLVQPALSVLK